MIVVRHFLLGDSPAVPYRQEAPQHHRLGRQNN